MYNNVLVTGGAGYVGSQTCKLLKKQGYNPVVFDNLETGLKSNVKWGEFFQGDLRNIEEIDACIKKVMPICVIHCAAYLNVFESINKPGEYFNNNVLGTLNLLNSMVNHNIKHIVFSSTCAVYGNVTKLPILEDSPINPLTPYASSKFAAEQLIKSYDAAYGIKSVILRYFNVAGADEDIEVGPDLSHPYHLINVAVKLAIGLKDKMYIFGDDYSTKDGTCIRDYIHNTDLAKAHLLSLEYLNKGNKSNLFNLGSKKGYTVKEVLSSLEKICNKKLNIEVTSRREGDPVSLVATTNKIEEFLNWKADYTNIDNIIKTAYDFAQNYKYH